MTFLQTTIDPDVVMRMNDSIRVATSNLIVQAKENPSAFVRDLIQSAVDFGLKLLAAIVIYTIGAWLIRRIKKGLGRMFERRNTEATLASFVTSLVSIILTVLLIVITIGTLGINTTSIAALLAAGGMAIGMALSGTVSNFAGGLMILVFKPFKAGDFINAQGYSGTVKEVSIVNTKIVTTDNRIVIIPNGTLSNGNIDNYSANPLRRLDIEVNVEYGTDAEACIKLLTEIITAHTLVLDSQTPGAQDPFVALLTMNDSNITFITRSWVMATDYWPTKFDLNKTIYEQLPKNGIEFSYPKLDVTIKN